MENYNDIDSILNQEVSNSQTLTDWNDESDDKKANYVDNLNQERLIINKRLLCI